MATSACICAVASPLAPLPGRRTQQQVMEVQRHLVGRIIGRGGETVGQIQQKSGTNVKIDQNVPEVRQRFRLFLCACFDIPPAPRAKG